MFDTSLSDNVCHRFAKNNWVSSCFPVFSIHITERSEITEILEEMTFNAYTIHLTLTYTYVQLVYTKQHQRNLQ